MRPPDGLIFEFKTVPPDAIRIFGWFHNLSLFIAAHCDFKSRLSPGYRKEIEIIVESMNSLPLDEPKVHKEKRRGDVLAVVC
jgi:hypothetical protein